MPFYCMIGWVVLCLVSVTLSYTDALYCVVHVHYSAQQCYAMHHAVMHFREVNCTVTFDFLVRIKPEWCIALLHCDICVVFGALQCSAVLFVLSMCTVVHCNASCCLVMHSKGVSCSVTFDYCTVMFVSFGASVQLYL